MSKNLYIIALLSSALFFFSCENEETNTPSIKKTEETSQNPNNKIDNQTKEKETTLEHPIEDTSEKTELIYFEDYAIFNTKEKLYDHFGEDHLTDGSSWYAEGTVEFQHTILRDQNNGWQITYLWQDDNSGTLNFIEAYHLIYDENYEVHGEQNIPSSCGINLGMSLKELRDWNNEDFEFTGFGWDYQGGLNYPNESKLAQCETRICVDIDYNADFASGDYMGDIYFSTADEEVLDAPIFVSEIVYYPN